MLERRIASLVATDTTFAAARPPFRLISIDQRQNRWNAVLELEGKISVIESYRTPWIPEKKQEEILLSSVQHLFAPGLDPKSYRKFKHNIRDDIAANPADS